jgi:hypothetical protein
MNKHLFVIFLSFFFSPTRASEFPGANGWENKNTSHPVPSGQEESVPVGCGFLVSVRHLAGSAYSTPDSSPELERRIFAILEKPHSNEEKAKVLAALVAANARSLHTS